MWEKSTIKQSTEQEWWHEEKKLCYISASGQKDSQCSWPEDSMMTNKQFSRKEKHNLNRQS